MTATATTRHLLRGDGATAPVGLTGRPPLILGEKTPPRTATATPVKPTSGHLGINSTTAQAVPRKRDKTGVPGNGASGRSAQGLQKPANCAWRATRPATSDETGEGKARLRNGRAPSGPKGAPTCKRTPSEGRVGWQSGKTLGGGTDRT
ncbi:MAG: hypothetical protein ILM98_14120 [Kiritimatiellae bacterium]|nr:hypothetical protein [Kiritimatiellia bacterium]